jgi:hypothetical protein
MSTTERTIKEFCDTGLLWFVNRTLHVFGWSLVYEEDDRGNLLRFYPARVSYRGFSETIEEENFEKLAWYMKNRLEELYDEAGYDATIGPEKAK